MPSRRDFLRASAIAGGLGLTHGRAALARAAELAAGHGRAAAPLDILVLGGTGFIGPHLVRHAVSRGHKVTIFTRGRRQADLPESVIRLQGDRNGQLQALEGKKWDAVIDDSATNPAWVRQSAQLLKGNVGQYLYTSSTGVYYPYLKKGIDEDTPVRFEATDPKDGSEAYAVAKANSEKEVREAFGDRTTVVRATYIVGPGDTTDRFPYWPVRLARGGEVLAPGRKDDSAQLIDVRDLTAFMVKLLEDKRGGVFNGAGPREPLTISRFLDEANKAVGRNVTFTWVDDYDFLAKHEVWGMVPWVLPVGNNLGHTTAKNERAIAAGLTFRPIADTVRDTLAWWPTVPAERRENPKFALTPEKEAQILAEWKQLKG